MSKQQKGKSVRFGSNEGVRVVNKRTGNCIVLLNPDEKSRKFATELKFGYAKTNSNQTKRTKDGKAIKLTPLQRAYRAGYLDRGKDNAKAFNARRK